MKTISLQRILFGITGACLLLAAPGVRAQTSGTLATQTSGNYSTEPWVIAPGGTGTYPDGGGTAEFDAVTGLTATVPGTTTITLDVSPTLSGITFNSPFAYTLAASGTNVLNLATAGATITATDTPASTPTLFSFGDLVSAPIAGGGAAGLTITGGGIVDLTGANTYTGGTTVTGGSTLALTTASDAALGATGTGNDVTLNGGTLLVYNATAATAMTTARNFTLGTGGGTFQLFNSLTVNGVISGSGALNYQNLSAGTLTLTGANTYTGATNSGGTLILSGANGAIASSSGYTFGIELSLDNSGTNNNARLSPTAPLTFDGTYTLLAGNSTAATAQAVGATTLNGGNTFLAITPNTATSTSLTFTSLARTNNATLTLTGTSLGATPGAGVATVLSLSAPTLVGGGGLAGSNNISIVPWIVGNTTANYITGDSLVTYNATSGFRPLATTEYAANLTSGATANVRLTAATTVPAGGATVNAVLVTKTGTCLSSTSGSVLNITSGAFLYSPTSGINSGTESANLNFGTAEGVISSTNYYNSGGGFLTMSGVLSGSGGLTLNALGGGYIVLSGANTYTGTTTLLAGVTEFSGTVANDGATAGAFGKSTTDIVFNPGASGLSFYATAASTINRNLTMTGSGSVDFGTTGNYILTVNGNLNLQTKLVLDGGETAASAMVLKGNISGAGSITDNSNYTPFTALNGNNTYSGGTNIQNGTYIVGSNTAFGTGTVSFSGTGTITTAGAYSLANNLLFGSGPTFAGTGTQAYGGTVNLDGSHTVTVTGGGTTFGGVVSNGALTKAGAGALTLSGANTYTGGTVIGAGSVFANNTSGSATGTGAVFVNASGTLLGGTGAVSGPVSVVSGAILQGGTGSNTGALTLNGNLTLVSGSIIELGLGSDGTNSSLTRGGGTWTLPTGIKFTFTGSPTIGQTYDNLITGLAADPTTENTWTVTNNGFTGTFIYDGAGDIDLTMTAVPEPATLLGGAICVGLLGWRLRRRAPCPAAR